eukprot:982704_1
MQDIYAPRNVVRYSKLRRLKTFRTRDLFASQARREKKSREQIVKGVRMHLYAPRTTVKDESEEIEGSLSREFDSFMHDQTANITEEDREVQRFMHKIYKEKRQKESEDRKFRSHTRLLLRDWSGNRARFDEESSRRQESSLYAKQRNMVKEQRFRCYSSRSARFPDQYRPDTPGPAAKPPRPYTSAGTRRLGLPQGDRLLQSNSPIDTTRSGFSLASSRPQSSAGLPGRGAREEGNFFAETPIEHFTKTAWNEPPKQAKKFEIPNYLEHLPQSLTTSKSSGSPGESADDLPVSERAPWTRVECQSKADDASTEGVEEDREAEAPIFENLVQPSVAWGPVKSSPMPPSARVPKSVRRESLIRKLAESQGFSNYVTRPGTAVSLSPYRPLESRPDPKVPLQQQRRPATADPLFSVPPFGAALSDRMCARLGTNPYQLVGEGDDAPRPRTAHIARRAELMQCDRIKTKFASKRLPIKRGTLERALVTPECGLTWKEQLLFPDPGTGLARDPLKIKKKGAAKAAKGKAKTKGKKGKKGKGKKK